MLNFIKKHLRLEGKPVLYREFKDEGVQDYDPEIYKDKCREEWNIEKAQRCIMTFGKAEKKPTERYLNSQSETFLLSLSKERLKILENDTLTSQEKYEQYGRVNMELLPKLIEEKEQKLGAYQTACDSKDENAIAQSKKELEDFTSQENITKRVTEFLAEPRQESHHEEHPGA